MQKRRTSAQPSTRWCSPDAQLLDGPPSSHAYALMATTIPERHRRCIVCLHHAWAVHLFSVLLAVEELNPVHPAPRARAASPRGLASAAVPGPASTPPAQCSRTTPHCPTRRSTGRQQPAHWHCSSSPLQAGQWPQGAAMRYTAAAAPHTRVNVNGAHGNGVQAHRHAPPPRERGTHCTLAPGATHTAPCALQSPSEPSGGRGCPAAAGAAWTAARVRRLLAGPTHSRPSGYSTAWHCAASY